MWKRLLLAAIVAHVSVAVHAAGSAADGYPNRPIKIIDGFPPGASADYMARIIGPKLTERFGQPVIVENRPGVGSNLGAQIVAQSKPDGYTLMMGVMTSLTSSPSLYQKLDYDLLKDMAFVTRVATSANVLLVHPSLPVKSVAELMALAREKPKALSYGSAGVGTLGQLAMELLQRRAGVELLHVPYKGGSPFVTGLTAGEVNMGVVGVAPALPMIQAKRLNALAVTSAKRIPSLPDVPTIAESGFPGFDVPSTFGVLAPAGTPEAIVQLLNVEIGKILQMEDVKAKFAAQGLEASGSTPEEFRAMTEAQTALWARVVKEANIPKN
jgi:tripartite-type tricarboxylate transporter receptor subunit TctC